MSCLRSACQVVLAKVEFSLKDFELYPESSSSSRSMTAASLRDNELLEEADLVIES